MGEGEGRREGGKEGRREGVKEWKTYPCNKFM